MLFVVISAWTNSFLSGSAADESIRTDLITKTVLAINESFRRKVTGCKDACPEAIVESVRKMSIDEGIMSVEARNLIKNLKSTFEVDWSPVQTWLYRLEKIQKTYFESVLKYRGRDSEPVKDALFYLDIGKVVVCSPVNYWPKIERKDRTGLSESIRGECFPCV